MWDASRWAANAPGQPTSLTTTPQKQEEGRPQGVVPTSLGVKRAPPASVGTRHQGRRGNVISVGLPAGYKRPERRQRHLGFRVLPKPPESSRRELDLGRLLVPPGCPATLRASFGVEVCPNPNRPTVLEVIHDADTGLGRDPAHSAPGSNGARSA